jgi:predicted nucleic acid-binding Zn ribbon protein
MRHRRGPRGAASAVGRLVSGKAPATLMAVVQRVWPDAAGAAIAAQATPTAARDGVVTVSASSSVWAQELELMSGELVGRLNAALVGATVRSLRVQATPSRGWASGGG